MNKSFTLIEILVVIVVIGVLSAFILVGMSSITSSANIAKSQAFLNSMDNSLLLGRVSQWKLDQVLGSSAPYTTPDAWGTNTGTLYGGATLPVLQTTGCVSSNCLYFDGTDDYVGCGTNVSIGTNSFTFSFWAKTSRNTVAQVAIYRAATTTGWSGTFQIPAASDRNGLFYITGATNHDIYRYYTPYASSSNTVDGRWHYFVGTCDRTQAKYPDVYLDGILTNGSAGAGFCNQLEESIPAGSFNIGSTGYQGFIDEVRFYNMAIPASQVQQNYYSGISSLLVNNGSDTKEFLERLTELKTNLANNE